MRANSKYFAIAGVLACLVGAVGYVAFGWRFGGDTSPVAAAVAGVAVALAVGGTVRDKL